MATIMDGKALSLKLKEQMKQRIAQLKQQGINPKLVVVLVGITVHHRYMCETSTSPAAR